MNHFYALILTLTMSHVASATTCTVSSGDSTSEVQCPTTDLPPIPYPNDCAYETTTIVEVKVCDSSGACHLESQVIPTFNVGDCWP